MPIYLFEYIDGEGQTHKFEQLCGVNDDFDSIMSPCGNYKAVKIIAPFNISSGVDTPTAFERSCGTTKRRKEFTSHVKQLRDDRKKNSEPGTRAHDSDELWIGNETIENKKPQVSKVVEKK